MTRSILTVTVNPALDVTTTTPTLIPQQKLRCSVPRCDTGGGGVNVSRAIRELGGESLAFVALGGGVGIQYRDLLEASGLDCEFWPVSGDTRFSLTAVEAGTGLHYRFVLPGPEQTPEQGERMLADLSQVLARGFRYVVASGSLLPGLPAEFYGRLADMARANGSRLILDTHGEALRAAAAHRPYLIRLNHLEAQELVGGDAKVAAHRLADELIARTAAEVVIITLGEEGAVLRSQGQQLAIRPPKVEVRSAVGAGDSFVAALTFALAEGWHVEDACRYGVAAAAATMTTEATELCHRATVNRLFQQIGGDLALVA